MKQYFLPLFFILITSTGFAQNKKPLDHSVYDGWKSIGERMISANGNFIVYAVNPQEGDGELLIQNVATKYKKVIPRGNNAVISNDSRFVYFMIKPLFQQTRQAKIRKRKPDEMPKDSLGMIELGQDSIVKIARVKSFKTPEKAAGFVAWHLEKPLADSGKIKILADSLKNKTELLVRLADSIIRQSIDSIKGRIEKQLVITAAQKAAKTIIAGAAADEASLAYQVMDAEGDEPATAAVVTEGTDLYVKSTKDSSGTKIFKLVTEYYFNKPGSRLVIETAKSAKDSTSQAMVLLYDLATEKVDTVMKGCNDCKNYAMDDDGQQLAFVAERDSSTKALQKLYKLWYFTSGQDSAILLADKNSEGMALGYTVSENGKLSFSKDGKKLFFGVAAIKPPKDTTLVDFELARLDIWHYNDDYLQPQQLKQLDLELKRSYLAVTVPGSNKMVQLGDENAENIAIVNEGNADFVLANSSKGNRVASQWTGRSLQTGYIISTVTGLKKLVKKDLLAYTLASPGGKFIYWYEPALKNYFTYEVATGSIKNVTQNIKVPLYNTENDVPDYPQGVGVTGWVEDDKYLMVNDEYDIWQVDPTGVEKPKNITNGFGRKNHTSFDYISFDKEKRFIRLDETVLLKSFNKLDKYAGYFTKKIDDLSDPSLIMKGPYSFAGPLKADSAEQYIIQRANINRSELFAGASLDTLIQLTDIASQQNDYNWLTVELVKWKMFDGKMSEGLLYKPANFDSTKKYPIIFYFYERNANLLYNYRPPAPSASIINVPYFVSNGYLVFDPNIYYTTGEPGANAYNSVVSAAKFLSKKPWVDSSRMALQGQSWGGYQVAYLITKTNIFRAAGAGAPVANMTSAYGGIRWGAGINRQFQYEKTQSRIGATLWQRPDLYIKNSPLFSADKITTPVLLTHNDADDAVPWYQGIEFFTALRRLNKKVWMLQYNGEAHNLQERKNRKDLSIRLAQFFDYYLKDAPPSKWIKDGLPATEKGKNWGLKVE